MTILNSKPALLLSSSFDNSSNDKKRTKLAKKLCGYGMRVQYSVFECRLDSKKLKEMKKEALKFIDKDKDSLRIYKICNDCERKIESFGIKQGIGKEDKPIII